MHKYLEYFEKIVGNETKEKELKNIVSIAPNPSQYQKCSAACH